MRNFLIALILLATAGAAQAGTCGMWATDISVDAMTDTRVEFSMTSALEGDAALGVRCESGELQLALVLQRLIITEGAGTDYRWNTVQLRVDKGQVHELTFLKVNHQLWASMDDSLPRIVGQIKAGSKIAVRVVEPRGHEDFTFSANGASACISQLSCDR